MWMSSEEARSDWVLAAAAAIVGGYGVGLIIGLPIYPRTGWTPEFLLRGWWLLLAGAVPYALARYRDQGAEAFGLARSGEDDRGGLRSGVLLALPTVVVGVLVGLPRGITDSILGRFGPSRAGTPTIGGSSESVLVLAVEAVAFVGLALGAILLFGFLTVRARDAFRRTELSVTEALRTFGMGGVAAALVLGLLRAIGPDTEVVRVVLEIAALTVTVLIADRLVPLAPTTSRATVLTPAIVALVLHLVQVGSFGGDLLLGLYAGTVAATLVLVIASLLETRRANWAVVPLVVAGTWFPTCLAPLPYEMFRSC